MGFNYIVSMILGSVRVFDSGVVHFIHHWDCYSFNFLCHFFDLCFGLLFKGYILFSKFFFVLSLSLCDVVQVEIFLTKFKDFFNILSGNMRKFTYHWWIEMGWNHRDRFIFFIRGVSFWVGGKLTNTFSFRWFFSS